MNPASQPLRPVSRRRFVGGAASAAAIAVIPASPAPGQDPQPPDQSNALEAEIDARMALVLARYGDRIDEAARQAVRADIMQHVRRARRLKAFALDNGDGPHTLMTAYRESP
jgi:hypothetical protein